MPFFYAFALESMAFLISWINSVNLSRKTGRVVFDRLPRFLRVSYPLSLGVLLMGLYRVDVASMMVMLCDAFIHLKWL